MNVLIIGSSDNGGASWWLSDAINKYTDHVARSVRMRQAYSNYPFDMIAPNKVKVGRLIEWADVIHTRDFMMPGISDKNKIRIVTFSGLSYRQNAKKLVPKMRGAGWFVTVSTSDLRTYYPQDPPAWLPNPREEMVMDKKHEQFTVCHAPTYRYRKGTSTIIKAFEALDADLELTENVSYVECIRRKAKCHALIDQFQFGYGNNAIEAWALGMPVISGAENEIYTDGIKSENGVLPFIHIDEDVEQIRQTIRRLMDDAEFRQTWADRGREYFYRWHHAPAVAKRCIEIYEMAKT